MSEKLKVYISGPITGREKEEYMDHFKLAELSLKRAGWEVVNPAEANEKLVPILPYDEIMFVCTLELRKCDAIYMLKGWEESAGAKYEYQEAEELGLAKWEE